MRRGLSIGALSIILLATAGSDFGGWAVVTVESIPEYLRVNEPVTLAFRVRQHGQTIRDDIRPSLTARGVDDGLLSRLFRRGRVGTTQRADRSYYEATITPDQAGMLALSIDTDIYGWTIELLPIPVLADGEVAPHLSPSERGRQLYAAKGCATCHAMRDDPAFADYQVISVSPPLTGRTFPEEWIAQKLANPARFRATNGPGTVMPRLELSDEEISSLVQYVNRHLIATGG